MRMNERIKIIQKMFDMTTGFPTPVNTTLFDPCFASVEYQEGSISMEKENVTNRRRTSFTIRYRSLPDNLVVEYRGLRYRIDEIIPNVERTYITLTGVVDNGS